MSELMKLRIENQLLKKGIESVRDLIDSSDGVSGLHLNGDIACWETLESGGHFEAWLSDFNEAEECINTKES